MPEDLMRYDLLAQQALRGVVRAALERVRRDGLPGDHHFYIAFDTNFPGAKLSDRLKRKYPEEMTVVLQHQFWGLEVHEHSFSVELSFDNVPEKLEVPFASIRGFFDPHVQFGLQFEMEEANQNGAVEEEAADNKNDPLAANPPKISVVGEEDAEAEPDDGVEETAETDEATSSSDEQETAEDSEEDVSEAKVVSLDAFRKQ
ncbi:MAG: ClpXP protease specificity-enhancing factor SspB [Pseudomonadota bacterium]